MEFTESIYKDLSRRDFTINAMAYNSAGFRKHHNTSASEKLSCVRLSAKTKTLILFFGMAHAHRLNVQNSSDLLTNSTLYDI